MGRVLRKRIWRDFRENLFRYLALGILIILCMYIVISLVVAAETIIRGVEKNGETARMEDGAFTTFVPLSQAEQEALTGEGISLEEQFFLDVSMEDGSVIRCFQDRREINLVCLDQGRKPAGAGETVLEKRYCQEHGLELGDRVTLGGKDFEIVGIGTAPDYDAPLRKLSDSTVDSRQFGLAFLTEEAYQAVKDGGESLQSEEYHYAYRLNGAMTSQELKERIMDLDFSPEEVEDPYFQEYWSELTGEKENYGSVFLLEFMMGSDKMGELLGLDTANLTEFVKAEDNPRIGASADDQIINLYCGLAAGVIIMILFTYVISVFVIHGIERESSVIGALYALGVKRRDLLRHYLLLPVLVTLAAGIIGTAVGCGPFGAEVQMADCYEYFSVPLLPVICPVYVLVYGIVMPPVTAVLVNTLVIRKKLSQPALRLLRGERKESRIAKVDLGRLGFIRRFRARQLLRELRTGFTVIFGMFIALLVMLLAIDCYVMCENLSQETKEDTRFEYMYTYKYPEPESPEGGEACFAKTLKRENLGYNLEVTLLGLGAGNPYFDAEPEKGKNKVVLSSAMAQKYGLRVGDQVVLSDEEEEIDYGFQVAGVIQYSAGLYAFMDIESMRELFGMPEDYYNVVFSDRELEIDPGRLYDVITREAVYESSDVFTELMMPMVIMMTVVSALVFVIVLYLMMRVVLDRSAFGISLLRVFGFRTGELRKLYLNGNFYVVALGALLCLPAAKRLMDGMYPMLVSNVACGMNLTFSWKLYGLIYGTILALYFLINQLLVGRLKKLVPADILKNRE